MFEQDINELVVYQNDWSEFPDSEGNSPVLSRLFDNLFSWIDPINGAGFFKNQNQLSAELVAENPDYDIQGLEDGFELEAKKLDAIRQRSSRGFTIYDINPGLFSEQDAPLNLPYEFLYDGSNFIPDQSDSIIKNFRTINIDTAGNFVKVEYIYENNSNANVAPSSRRPYANIKYNQALKNAVGENDLSTGYLNYYFDNFARNKVFLGFGDSVQKPHLITKSGDYFNTYFNTLTLHFNIGAPKIRITVGFNSEKHDGPNNDAINSRLHLAGGARIFSNLDTPLMPMNICASDTFKPTPVFGISISTSNVQSSIDVTIARAIGDLNSSLTTSFGYSVLFITDLLFFYSLGSNLGYNLCVEILVSNASSQEVRLAKIPIALDPTAGSQRFDTLKFRFGEPLRAVIPYNNNLVARLIFRSGAAGSMSYDIILQGYSLGNIRKIDSGINYDMLASKFITDSTFLTDFNRVEAVRD